MVSCSCPASALTLRTFVALLVLRLKLHPTNVTVAPNPTHIAEPPAKSKTVKPVQRMHHAIRSGEVSLRFMHPIGFVGDKERLAECDIDVSCKWKPTKPFSIVADEIFTQRSIQASQSERKQETSPGADMHTYMAHFKLESTRCVTAERFFPF
jgi:hypothetical protein